ncbi:MAG: DUF2520 domain-containing protein [Candidatus Kryptoniota bacterium]
MAAVFSLVGPGRAGSSLARALNEAGWRCSTIVRKGKSAKESPVLMRAFHGTRIAGSIRKLSNDFDVLFIAVQDDTISVVADQLSKLEDIEWKKKVVLHLSGATDLDALSGLKRKGAKVGALHPIASFANKLEPEAARGIYYDFLGDRGAETVARRIVGQLNSKLLVLKSENQRTRLHLAGAFASNSTIVAVTCAKLLISGFVRESDATSLLRRLLQSTFENLSNSFGMESLTGPLKRGDVSVIRKHVKALENEPELLQFYVSWSLLGVEELLKVEHDAFRKARLKEIKKILEDN